MGHGGGGKIMSALQQAQQLLGNWVQNWSAPEENRLDADVTPENLLEAVKALDEQHWGYLIAITGLDSNPEAGVMEVLYHFSSGAAVLTLRVTVPREMAVIPSICRIIPYASVFERELSEMFGVEVYDTPDSSRLYLPDDWKEGVYPLRKDVKLK
jgi:Ni,Fe-hydrogenase III component G